MIPDTITIVRRLNPEQLMEAVVDHLEHRLLNSIEQMDFCPLGLATGRTMEPLYAALVARLSAWPGDRLQLLRQRWLSFNLDEYVGLPPEHPRSFCSFMGRHLARPLGLDPSQLLLPDGASEDPAGAAARYAAAVSAAGGIGMQILGLGSNGHVGFNEPPCVSDVRCRVVTLSATTRKQNAPAFEGSPNLVPLEAITLGLYEILAANEIHLIVTGASKSGILRKTLDRDGDPNVPASWLLRHPRLWLWVDDAALGEEGT
jgi:glucosamine-6-phosphate deaminase|tara:strand:- start:1953 stop:2729 length:777 start_codon:yes stop_codon:yes gene_type:complete